MTTWTRVSTLSELAPGEYRVIESEGTRIVVVNVDGDCFALEDVCTHDGGELSGGVLEGCELVCPRHGARFDVRSGEALCAPAYEPTASFPIKIEDGVIFTRDDRWD